VKDRSTSVLTRVISKLLLVPTLVAALAVLVKGYVQPGDGFSAGVIAGLGVLLQYLAFDREVAGRLWLVRYAGVLAFAGLLLALAVAVAPLFLGDAVLTHYPPPGAKVVHLGTLEVITAVAFDVGVFLLVFGFAVGAINIFSRSIAGEEEYAVLDAPEPGAEGEEA
jgi:multisubunit Na+/H+ antiporter MnhB subunit